MMPAIAEDTVRPVARHHVRRVGQRPTRARVSGAAGNGAGAARGAAERGGARRTETGIELEREPGRLAHVVGEVGEREGHARNGLVASDAVVVPHGDVEGALGKEWSLCRCLGSGVEIFQCHEEWKIRITGERQLIGSGVDWAMIGSKTIILLVELGAVGVQFGII